MHSVPDLGVQYKWVEVSCIVAPNACIYLAKMRKPSDTDVNARLSETNYLSGFTSGIKIHFHIIVLSAINPLEVAKNRRGLFVCLNLMRLCYFICTDKEYYAN